MRQRQSLLRRSRGGRRGFSLPELLIVVGILSLLMAILLPPLQLVVKQASTARCAHQLRQIGYALSNMKDEFGYYPIWDDAGAPVRFTFIDVLVQKRQLADRRVGYCPDDPRPCDVSAARGSHHQVVYPGRPDQFGIDYSYGIAVPSASGRWFEALERSPAQRVLSADSNWSTIYNTSGNPYGDHDWSYPTQYDNMIEYRHVRTSANILYEDGHVAAVAYAASADQPVNTAVTYVWHPGEATHVNPTHMHNGHAYPCVPPVDVSTGVGSDSFPRDVVPGYYTYNRLWVITK